MALVATRDASAAPQSRLTQELRDYWRARGLDEPQVWLGGAYASAIGSHHFQGAPVRSPASFDLTADALVLPRVMAGAAYGRDRWQSSGPSKLDLRFNRIEFRLAVDLIALPYWWRVRPAVLPMVAFGTAWGRSGIAPPRYEPASDRQVRGDYRQKWMGGIGANFGADAAVYIRLGRWVTLQLRAGISRPTYLLRAGRQRIPYDDEFPRAWRWSAGVSLGPGSARLPEVWASRSRR